MTRRRIAMAALAAAPMIGTGCSAVGASDRPATETVRLTARYSRWSVDQVTVKAGTSVRFVVSNDDPIDHELIAGDDAVHARHEAGTEARHPPRPGEVSVPAGAVAETTLAFPGPGTYTFACHLPGHFAYGMRGTVTVVP